MPVYKDFPALAMQTLDDAGLLDHQDLLVHLEHTYYNHRAKIEHTGATQSLARKRARARSRGDD